MSDTVSTAEIEAPEEIGVDPVCGAAVDVELARQRDLLTEFAEREYAFCSATCRNAFCRKPEALAVSGRSQP